jgi:hypothetical protein
VTAGEHADRYHGYRIYIYFYTYFKRRQDMETGQLSKNDHLRNKAGQLHELLAVESDLRGVKDKEKNAVTRDFTTKPGMFLGAVKQLKMFDESRKNEDGEARQEVEDTVMERINNATGHFVRYWNLRLQKESANQAARSDVMVDGKAMFTNVPVTFLLNMEEEIRQLKQVYAAAPTLQPGIAWVPDEQKGRGIYKSEHKEEKTKGEKSVEFTVMVPATEHHPAQVKEWSSEKIIGKFITENWSGMITPADKSIMLSRVDKLLAAFKKARQRANCQETLPIQIGKEIIDYIHAK